MPFRLGEMAGKAQTMLKKVLDAFVSLDNAAAHNFGTLSSLECFKQALRFLPIFNQRITLTNAAPVNPFA